jgi:DNA polymerase I-like protein with 3'-5' exonuclease and polymerase domains
MYCDEHVYWKDEGKTWDASTGEDQLWSYNCKDCVITYEVDQAIQSSVDKLGLRAQHDFQQEMFWPVLQAMIRGVRVDTRRRSAFALELSAEIAKREQWFIDVLGHPLNPRSPLQMKRLFYEDLHQKEIFNRKSGTVTLDDEALEKIGAREPLLRPLVRAIAEHRSLGVFLSTFVQARLDSDGRLRCSFNIAGTETFRLSSSKNAFGSGLNLQNIPKGGSVDEEDLQALRLPNVRKLFIPDAGATFFDCDLDRADLQVVVWEADDTELRQMLLEGVNIHTENAKLLGVPRPIAKAWVHATDYGAGPRTMAALTGLSIHRCEQLRTRWFSAHPGIAEWHRRVEATLRAKRYAENAYGYRRYYFDRIEGLLPEALAWIPQSTVALYINKIWLKLYKEVPDVQVLLQVHDSLAGQFPTHLADWCVGRIRDVARSIVVPYDTPLVIPLGIKTSVASWGDCE